MDPNVIENILRNVTTQDLRDFVKNHPEKLPLENDFVVNMVRHLMPGIKLPSRITSETKEKALDVVLEGIDAAEEYDTTKQRSLPTDKRGIMGMVSEGIKDV